MSNTIYTDSFQCYGDDLEVWSTEDEGGFKYYHLGIEGFVAYESIQKAIDYYEKMKDGFKKWLEDNKTFPPIENNKNIYRSYDIEILKDQFGYYWIYTDGTKSSNLYDTYLWFEGFINQLKTIINDIGRD